jgi:hypothetical protein
MTADFRTSHFRIDNSVAMENDLTFRGRDDGMEMNEMNEMYSNTDSSNRTRLDSGSQLGVERLLHGERHGTVPGGSARHGTENEDSDTDPGWKSMKIMTSREKARSRSTTSPPQAQKLPARLSP